MGIPTIGELGKKPLTAMEKYSRAKVKGSLVKVPIRGDSQWRERVAHRYKVKRYGETSSERDAYPTVIFREHRLPNLLFPAVIIWQRVAAGAEAHGLNRKYPLNRRPK
jgi:hypothetical protein